MPVRRVSLLPLNLIFSALLALVTYEVVTLSTFVEMRVHVTSLLPLLWLAYFLLLLLVRSLWFYWAYFLVFVAFWPLMVVQKGALNRFFYDLRDLFRFSAVTPTFKMAVIVAALAVTLFYLAWLTALFRRQKR